ncbi:MAG: carbonic anhydrase [Bacteroidetes bacterium HGW-Bacteroidetes-17]|nr:MAG: carbonic anhydrase [Bacteroidetes bacterium HGW-Bacteroidetes-17]
MKKIFNYSFLSIAFTAILFSCNYSVKTEKSTDPETHQTSAESKSDCNEVHWSHATGESGPENWKNLCDGYTACGGVAQSPINFVTNTIEKSDSLSPLNIIYKSSKTDIINNGHTVQFNTSGDNTLLLGNKEYELKQFHFHAMSEHTVDGYHYPIEVHFVHRHSDTDYAVLGIMYEEGEENPLLTDYLNNFPESKGEFTSDKTIDLSKLYPADLGYYYYSGSLTTPPCSEIVSWYVLKTPLQASKTQIDKFSKILNNNYRPVMPLNDRKVYGY